MLTLHTMEQYTTVTRRINEITGNNRLIDTVVYTYIKSRVNYKTNIADNVTEQEMSFHLGLSIDTIENVVPRISKHTFLFEKVEQDEEKKEQEYNQVIKQTFKPEFINRIDDIIIFNPLNKSMLNGIVDKFLSLLQVRLQQRNINLQITDIAKEKIIEEGSDVNYGARPLKRFIQQNIETLVAYKIIQESISENASLQVDYQNGKFVVNKL